MVSWQPSSDSKNTQFVQKLLGCNWCSLSASRHEGVPLTRALELCSAVAAGAEKTWEAWIRACSPANLAFSGSQTSQQPSRCQRNVGGAFWNCCVSRSPETNGLKIKTDDQTYPGEWQMLESMWETWDRHTFLVGMWPARTIRKPVWQYSKCTRHLPFPPATLLLRYLPKRNAVHTDVHIIAHSSFIHKPPKLGTTQMSTKWWTDKRMTCSIPWTTTSNKKEQGMKTDNSMVEFQRL